MAPILTSLSPTHAYIYTYMSKKPNSHIHTRTHNTYTDINTNIGCENNEPLSSTHTYTYTYKLIERNPPPRGGFFVGWFPNQEPWRRGPPLKNNPQTGSFFSGFWVWKPPNKERLPGGGVSCDEYTYNQIHTFTHTRTHPLYINIHAHIHTYTHTYFGSFLSPSPSFFFPIVLIRKKRALSHSKKKETLGTVSL